MTGNFSDGEHISSLVSSNCVFIRKVLNEKKYHYMKKIVMYFQIKILTGGYSRVSIKVINQKNHKECFYEKNNSIIDINECNISIYCFCRWWI